MRKVVVSEFITLDGVIEDPSGAEGTDPRPGQEAVRRRRPPPADLSLVDTRTVGPDVQLLVYRPTNRAA